MSAPKHLTHRPILEVSDYLSIDGYHKEKSDAMALSLGVSQWDLDLEDREKELSLKVWRHTGKRWSRQSEELPLHRALDLASLLCIALKFNNDKSKGKKLELDTDFPVSISYSNESPTDEEKQNIDLMLKFMEKDLEKNKESLDNSLKRLSKQLKSLGY